MVEIQRNFETLTISGHSPILNQRRESTKTLTRRLSDMYITPVRQPLIPKTWDSASVFLLNVKDFTTICSLMTPQKSKVLLQRFFERVDSGLEIYGMELMDIMRDTYLAMNGGDKHHEKTVQFAIFCINAAQTTFVDADNPSLGTVHIRTAVHSGKVHSIVLYASPFRYTLVGPSIAIVKFLENEGHAGAVHCSAAVIDNIRLAPIGNIIISPHKTMTLNAPTASPAYQDEFEKNKDTQTYLVYHRRLSLEAGDVMLCAYTLKFLKVSTSFCRFFRFRPRELQSFRMLCGPDTDIPLCKQEFRNAFEFRKEGYLSTVLYTKSGTAIDTITMVLTHHNDKQKGGCCGVCITV